MQKKKIIKFLEYINLKNLIGKKFIINGKKNLRIVIALFPEAKSLIKLYKLNEYNSAENIFKIYCNKNSNIWLVISGIGNVNSVSATTYLYLKSPIINKNIWINFGMGGSNSLKVGEIYNIKKVTYKTRDKLESFYTSAIINTDYQL